MKVFAAGATMNFTPKLWFWSKRRLQRQIDSLPADQLEVLVLVCVENLTYAEAATVLNVPVETVVSRLLQSRRSLIASGERAYGRARTFRNVGI